MINVLLVDDDDTSNFITKKMLEHTGLCYTIQLAANGAEALNSLKLNLLGLKPNPDVIFLDLNMPVMGGFGFLEAFKKLPLLNKAKIKIVILSSSEDPKDLAKAREFEIKHYLTKPVSGNCLKGVLNDMFSLKQTG